MYVKIIKPGFDIIVSAIALILLSPFIFFIGLCLYFANKGHVFFAQKRVGKDGRLFTIYKFKTMNDRTDDTGVLLPDHERLTGMGKVVRKSSLDELPQLLNVLKGEMSLVGPRPLLPEYLPLYNREQMKRHNVRPGITGWAQVNGRNALSWEEKFTLDVWYAGHVTLALDLNILWMTVKKIGTQEGVNAAKNITMERFKGSNP